MENKDLIEYLVKQGSVYVNKDMMGGIPCLNGHRIAISHILGDMGAGVPAREFALDYDIDEIKILDLLEGISDYIYQNYEPKRKLEDILTKEEIDTLENIKDDDPKGQISI